ncbi:unnamed protein product [Acanthosepion pharaonis]|uniref:Transmembrane protein n=1 Tax=Acanthosepion pharaonis TaxID=158019 RepID=A0A812AJH6_ACAPH|nr:unnamed protein product [Sepia pharaonis]
MLRLSIHWQKETHTVNAINISSFSLFAISSMSLSFALFSLLLIVLSFLSHVSSFLSFFFFTQVQFHTRSGCNRDIHFLSLSGFLFSFFLLLYIIQLQTRFDCNRDIYFLLSGFLFSFFKRRLYSQRTNFLASFVINNSIYLLQFGVNEQKYISSYFLSGVAWDESDKFHHYQNESHLSVHKLSALRFRVLLLQRQDN